LEALEDRWLLSNFTLGPLVQVSVTNPFAGSTADHPEIQPGTFAPDSEVEPYVVVDPTDRDHLVGIWQQDRWSGNGSRRMVVGVTFDGGRSWQEVVPPGLSQVAGGAFQRASDDWLSFAPNGDLYLSVLSFNPSAIAPAPFGESTVLASKSTDGGLTWSNPVTITDTTTAFNDKDVITADPSNPNIAYLVWTPSIQVGVQGSAALFSRTTDGGQTWEPARVLYDAGPGTVNRPVQIVVEPDGTLVYFSTERRLSGTSTPELTILRSTDRGETWQGPIQIGLMETIGVTDPDRGGSLRNGPVIYAATIDPNNGNLYAAWQDARFSQGQHDSIAFAMSTDDGLTWSQPIQINQTPTDIPAGDQQAFRPSIAVAANGTVAVTYYDFRFNDPSPGLATDYWFVRGDPHGQGGLTNPANWGDELRLTDSSFDIEKAPDVSGPFVGDYQGLAAVGNGFVTFFAQPHGTDPDSIFSRRIDELATVSLEPNAASSHLVGDPVTWTATATNCGETPVYQFSVGAAGGSLHVVRDFSPSNSFTWAPMQEGSYNVEVTVKAGFDAAGTHSAIVSYLVDSRVTGSAAVISPTSNPLVALYSVPSGPAGTVHAEFSIAGVNPSWRSTDERLSVPGKSTNFFVAGMLPSTTYQMRYVRSDGTTSSPLLFTTGAIPASLVFPSFTVIQSPGPGSNFAQDMLFLQLTGNLNNVPNPLATDLSGRVVWYYDVSQSGLNRTFPGQSLVAGGTVLLLGVDRYAPLPGTLDVLRETDLAGDSVRETNIDAVNAQLTARGYNPVFSFTHDVQRLPNGQTVVIGSTERTVTINGIPTDYVGMTIVVLDQDFQVVWAWDGFDHLDVNRGPILGEILHPGDADQVAASTPRLPAVDWLHINAVSWSPADGNLVLSVRDQDWVIKIDYRNGEGDGHIIWRLGQGGDFTVNSTDSNPWFSHQHNAHFIDDSTLILFDNGDTRRANDPNADSRGQVWRLDEQTMTATLVLNVDLGNYSDAP
jgi:hypothetical protein